MLAAIKITPSNLPKSAVGTFFAPSDMAVQSFLKAIGYSAAELLDMPVLMDLIVSYHFIPGHQVALADVSKGPKLAATGDDNFIVRLNKGASGALTVQDAQGSTATVAAGPFTTGKLTIFVIDKVLMSGNYFTSAVAALQHYPFWSSAIAYIRVSGVQQQLNGSAGGDYTLFVPENVAFKPVEDMLATSPGKVADIMKYHVATGGIRNIPRGFKNGTLPTLLTGRTVTVTSFPS
eukprot:gene11855-11999_t